MSEKDIFYVNEYIPVPPILHSVEKEGLFDKCIVCQRNLLDEDTRYLIEKGFRGERVIFEYAICYGCRDQMAEGISLESRKKLGEMWNRKVDLKKRRRKLLKKSKTNIEPWIEYCILGGDRRDKVEAYQIYAECQGSDMLFSYHPYIIGELAIEELIKLLSKKTLDILGDFIDEYLGLGPEFSDVPQEFLLLV